MKTRQTRQHGLLKNGILATVVALACVAAAQAAPAGQPPIDHNDGNSHTYSTISGSFGSVAPTGVDVSGPDTAVTITGKTNLNGTGDLLTGIWVDDGGDVRLEGKTTIELDGAAPWGLSAEGGGSISALDQSTIITLQGGESTAIFARDGGSIGIGGLHAADPDEFATPADASVRVGSDAAISTSGIGAQIGVHAFGNNVEVITHENSQIDVNATAVGEGPWRGAAGIYAGAGYDESGQSLIINAAGDIDARGGGLPGWYGETPFKPPSWPDSSFSSVPATSYGIYAYNANSQAGTTTVTVSGQIDSDVYGVAATGGKQINININKKARINTDDAGVIIGIPQTCDQENDQGCGGNVTIHNKGTITTTGGHGINVFNATSHNTIYNSGDISADSTLTDEAGNPLAAIWGGQGQERVFIKGGTVTGNIDLGGSEPNERDELHFTGGAIKGAVYMGRGDDNTVIGAGANPGPLTVLDGEGPKQLLCPGPGPEIPDSCFREGSEPPPALALSKPDIQRLDAESQQQDSRQGRNTLVLNNELTGSTTGAGNGGAGAAGNTRIANWDTIQIGTRDAGRLNLTGGINNGRGDGSLGTMTIGSAGTLALAPGIHSAQVAYTVTNSGDIDLTPGHSEIIIAGDYHGNPGSRVLVKSHWNNPDVQTSDHLIITGNADGETQVAVPGGIIGDVTLGSQPKNGGWQAPVVTVKGTDQGSHNGNTFYGTAPTSNAGQAQLARHGNSYYWTLQAATPDDDNGPVPIYIHGASGYAQMSGIDRELGLLQIGTLHERRGELQTWAWDNCGTVCADYRKRTAAGNRPYPLWGRIYYGELDQQGEQRLGYDSDTFFVQIGADLNVKTDAERNHRHFGVMATYSRGDHDFYDKYRARSGVVIDDKHTGSGTTDMLSLGTYSTWYRSNGTYLSLLGNLSWLHNKYDSNSGDASQDGYGIGLSAEVGRPWRIGASHWQIEPQAQLSYQYVNLEDFDDDIRTIDGQSDGTLRGRLGLRLAWNDDNGEQRTDTFYVTANVLHDFTGDESTADIGNDHLVEDYASTWGELGVGGQFAIGDAAYLYGDVRYQHSIDGDSNTVYRSSGTPRESYSARVGVRLLW